MHFESGRSKPFEKVVTDYVTGIRFLWVPGGSFVMGSEDGDEDEQPIHQVTVCAFWLASTPVTNQQYDKFAYTWPRQPRYWNNPSRNQPKQPVVGVSWYDASAFCEWLSRTLRRTIRLPREAEWEFAARSTDGRRYPWGDDMPSEQLAWFGQDTGNATFVDRYPSSKGPFGHSTLAGNVEEWCLDAWDAYAYQREEHQRGDNPEIRKSSNLHVKRGGSFLDNGYRLRAVFRNWDDGYCRDWYSGFRPCMLPWNTD